MVKKSTMSGEHAKKVVSDSPGLVDFSIGLVNSVLKLAQWASEFFLTNSKYRRFVKSSLLIKKLLG